MTEAVSRNGMEDLAGLADRYLEMLLDGDRREAIGLVMDAVQRGVPIKEFYLKVFQPVQYRVGELWQRNRISVAQEHYCTAATQLAMAMLYPRIFQTPKTGLKMVGTCVEDELHELGIRMVADFFEMEGWDTHYLGASTPTESVVETVRKVRPDVLAVSVSVTVHLPALMDLVRAVRQLPEGGRTKIMVGGRPFNLSPNLWERVGADGWAADAEGALRVAAQWVRGSAA